MEEKDLKAEYEEFFQDTENKTSIWLKGSQLGKRYLERLGEFKNLKELNLEGIKTIPDEVAALPVKHVMLLQGKADRLERFLNMESLQLEVTPVPETFTIIDRLKKLWINQSFKKEPVPQSVGTLVNLKELKIMYTYTGDISAVSSLKDLESLEIIDGKLDTIDAVGELKNLRKLIITSQTDYSTGPLKDLVNLKELELKGNFSDIGPLSGLYNLQKLDLNCDVNDLTAIGNLHKLEKLDISICFEIKSIEPLLMLKNLKKLKAETHFMNQWKTRHIPESSQKILSQVRQPSDILQERMDGLIRAVRAYPGRAKKILPIQIDQVEKLLSEIDEEGVARLFKNTFMEGINALKGPENFQALRYEWYEGGNKTDNLAMGRAFETCEGPFFYSGSDYVKVEGVPGIEMDEPRFKGETIEVMELDMSPVRMVWYENVSKLFDDEERRSLVDSGDLLFFYNNTENLYQELFFLKLYMLANRAYDSIQEEKPRFCFFNSHERWPVLVSGF